MKWAVVRRRLDAMGGAELYVRRLLAELVRLQHDVVLVTDAPTEVAGVANIHAIQLKGSRSAQVSQFNQQACGLLSDLDVDCVFSLERIGQQEVYRAGDGVHRVWLEQRRKYAPWWKRPFIGRGSLHQSLLQLEAETFNPANTRHIIVNSKMVRREILENFPFPAERIHLIRNGVDVSRCRSGDRTGTRARFGVRDDEFLLLFAGSGWERKGLAYVLGALRKLENPRVKLLVAGKGRRPLFPPAGVIFAGPMPDLENAYAAADLFVFPPIYEPSANVCFEALAAGLPVVTSACNGAAEVIEEKVNGSVVFDPSDVNTLVKSIRFWQRRPAVRPVLTQIDLSIERNVRETLAVLELAAAERAVGRGR